MVTKDLTHEAIARALTNGDVLTHEQRSVLLGLVADDKVWQRRHDRLQQALKDIADPVAASAASVDVPSAQGTLTEALAWEKGLPAPRWYERNNTEVLGRLFRKRVLGETAGTAGQARGLFPFSRAPAGVRRQTENPA